MNFRVNIAAALAALACAFLLPGAAFADYSNPSVSTVAQVRTDGSLHVAEQRTYDFEDAYSILTWPTTGWSGEQKVEPESVRFTQVDSEGNVVRDWTALPQVAFQSMWREFVESTEGLTARVDAEVERERLSDDTAGDVILPDGEAWAFDSRRGVVYIFLEPTDAVTAIECDYLVDNAALVWDDVGELYWDYVAASDDVVTRNVSVQVQLPVPEGAAVVPGENLLAWGHGAVGEVSVSGDGTVDFSVPKVEAGQYAQAHIVFPKQWMTNLTIQAKLAKSGPRYDDAVAEEEEWVDSYSAWKINSLTLDIVMMALCVLALAGSLVVYAALGRERRPRCAGAVANGVAARSGAGSADAGGCDAAAGADVGAGCSGVRCCDDALLDEAAVMGRLARWNHESADDFSAVVAQLQRKGVIRIDEAPAEPDAGPRDAPDARFRVTASAKRVSLSTLERDAMRFVFDDVGGGYQSVSLDDVRAFCERRPADVQEAMSAWQAVLSRDIERAALFDARSRTASRWMLAGAGLLALLALYQWLVARSPFEAAALVATAIVVALVAHFVPRLTQRGADLAECLRMQEVDDDPAWMARLSDILEQTIEGMNDDGRQ